jgi:D-sedoheptulose 7-phosphate isomerase
MTQQLSEVIRKATAGAFARRERPAALLAGDAELIALTCHDMAVSFARGGKLLVFGNGGPATDAQHIAVEFVHPVIVGKRALPALSLTADAATVTGVATGSETGFADVFAHQLRYLAEPGDIALGVSDDGHDANVLRGMEVAAGLGLLTIALTGGDGGPLAASPAVRHCLIARAGDPRVVKEIHVTTYHILWELVHVFFERPGLLDTGAGR